MRTHVTALLLGGLAVGLLATPFPATAAEPGHPTGTFHLTHSTAYLHEDGGGVDDPYADFTVYADTLADDSTATEDLEVKVLDGSGRSDLYDLYGEYDGPFKLWRDTTEPLRFRYDSDGTFAPRVYITDSDHNTTVVLLSDVQVVKDWTAPTFTLDSPRPGDRSRSSAWRVIRGRIADTGVGARSVYYQAMQKRGGTWYYFKDWRYFDDPRPGRWMKGRRTLAATRSLANNENLDTNREPEGRWRSDRIVRITHGPMVVCLRADDRNDNSTRWRCVSGRITRR